MFAWGPRSTPSANDRFPAAIGAIAAANGWGQAPPPPPDIFFVAPVMSMHCGEHVRAHTGAVSGAPAPFGNVVTDAPYSGTGTTETVTTLADGNRIVRKNTMRYFRDSQGRTRTEYSLSSVGPFTLDDTRRVVMINDTVAGKRYIVHPAQKQVAVLPDLAHAHMHVAGAGAGHVSGFFNSATPAAPVAGVAGHAMGRCDPAIHNLPEPTKLGERYIEGVRVVGSRVEFEIPAGRIGNEQPITVRSEQWFSPELGVVIESTHSDPTVGETHYRLSQISRAEPDAALFKPPADYTIHTPHEGAGMRIHKRMMHPPAESAAPSR